MQPQVDVGAIPLFAELPKDEIAQLNGLAHPQSYRASDIVVREGETDIGVYVITSGQFEIRHGVDGGGQLEATLGPGDVFGLTSMLDEGPRRATVVAATDGTCLVLTRLTFWQAVRSNPSLAIEVMRAMARDLRDTTALLRQEGDGG